MTPRQLTAKLSQALAAAVDRLAPGGAIPKSD
jgi:uncharacterized protein YidB (DUF937 family)